MVIAVSACLLGVECRYDGKAKPDARLAACLEGHRAVPVCPEVAGGLPTPRPPSEIVSAWPGLRVESAEGDDVTEQFVRGAQATVDLALESGCALCVLKSKSPSCGPHGVYDGTFGGKLVAGEGVAARALREAGLRCVDEDEAVRLLAPSR